MNPVPVFTAAPAGPRLLYILDWLFSEQTGTGYTLIHDRETAAALPFCISYGAIIPGCCCIPDAGLVTGLGTGTLEIARGMWQDIPVFFYQTEEGTDIPFDLFSALFFFLSRYEEYHSSATDRHGRYPATESLLFRYGLLQRPLADEWTSLFRSFIRARWGVNCMEPEFSHLPTYDIDIAWSYRNKGFTRNAGGAIRDLLQRNFSGFTERIRVFAGLQPDPYDAFSFIGAQHSGKRDGALFFILAAERSGPFDKNISPHNPAMETLIRTLDRTGETGLHPSYGSSRDASLLRAEKKCMERITGRPVTISRQHYIRMNLPATYRLLSENGIMEDFTMGYGTHTGFRAATGRSFLWYDLERETVTGLRVHPFCFMDTTARFGMGLDADAAFLHLDSLKQRLVSCQSRMVTIFHNFSLGTDPGWKGWREKYAAFLGSCRTTFRE